MSLVTEAYQKLKSAGRLFNCGPDNFDCVKCKNTVPEDSRSASFDKRDNRYNQKAPKKVQRIHPDLKQDFVPLNEYSGGAALN